MAITQAHKHGGTAFYADGRQFTIVTDATPSEAVVRFNRLAHDNDAELSRLTKAVDERRAWNLANRGAACDWPEFRQLDRLVSRLCREAGIVDS